MTKKIGWIGCGKMGRPMAENFLNAGYDMTVYDVVKQNTDYLVKKGAHSAACPKDVAATTDTIFLSLPNGIILQSVVCDKKIGVAQGLSRGKTVIDTSTVSPEESMAACKEIEKRGASFLRAPVTGSTVLAESASLGVFASGDKACFDEVLPMLKVMSSNQHYLGSGEQARVLKLAINLMIAVNMQMLAEALTLAEKSGVDREQAMHIIGKSAAGSPVINYKINNIVQRDYTAAFDVAMMEKDMDLLLDVAKQYKVSIPVAAITRQYYTLIHKKGKEDLDFSYLVEFWGQLCTLEN